MPRVLFDRRARPGTQRRMSAWQQCRIAHMENRPFGYQVGATEELCVRRGRGWQGELKSCTTPGDTCGPQVTAMRLDDRPTNGQAHTSPVIFGRKECFEDLFRLLRGQSHTGIGD